MAKRTIAEKLTVEAGVKHDQEKVRMELLPVTFMRAVAVILTFGAKKYGARNWEKGFEWSRAYGALLRHLFAWWGGEAEDPETKRSHLWHAGCELAFLIHFEEMQNGTDDRPPAVPPLAGS